MTEPAPSADLVAGGTRVLVEHQVYFQLADEDRFVVPRRGRAGYVSVGYITVTLQHSGGTFVTASGSICKKDGSPSLVTRMNESVTLPDEAAWVERARRQIDGSVLVDEDRIGPLVAEGGPAQQQDQQGLVLGDDPESR